MSDSPDDSINSLYERHAAAWVAARLASSRLMEQAWLERFCRLLPRGAALLDLGCGAGRPIAAWLAEAGYAITGVDASPSMVAMFRANLPAQEALVHDMRTLALGRTFQGILAWDSFFHLRREDQRRMFPVFRAHAAPGCALLFTSGPADGEAIGSFAGEALYHASLGADEYRALLAEHEFDVVEHIVEDPDCGGHTIWLAQARRA